MTESSSRPELLRPNLVVHTYRGGDRIAALRGLPKPMPNQPEEWLGATISRSEDATIGLAVTTAGVVLREIIRAHRVEWLGPHADLARDLDDTGILFKLLDAGQRLPVHVHPSRSFARQHLDCPYGKTEAWLVLSADPGGVVYLGWKEDVDPDELAARRDSQDGEWMLERLNRIEVREGMGILVPAGTPHAIGEGVLVAEVQEPTDFSIVLEWSVTDLTADQSHLGLGFDVAMAAVDTTAMSPDQVRDLIVSTDLTRRSEEPIGLLPARADKFFRLELVAPVDEGVVVVDRGYSVVVVLSGHGRAMGTANVGLQAGDVVAIPHDFGDWRASGDLKLLCARPGRDWPESLVAG